MQFEKNTIKHDMNIDKNISKVSGLDFTQYTCVFF